MELVEILEQLNAAFGPSGQEDGIADVIGKLARPYVDEISRDTLGNLICHKRGSGPRVMFAAHMDSVGLMVTHVEENGLLRVGKLGGVRPASILHAPVRFRNGVRGTVACNADAQPGTLKLDDLYIDIGAATAEEARARADTGDPAVYDTPVRDLGDKILSPYLDDRIGCAVLLLAMERLRAVPRSGAVPRLGGGTDNDLYFVFTAQEELGTRGAATAAYALEPDYALAVDVMLADDQPGAAHISSVRQGAGAGIKVMDHSMISHPAVVEKLKALAADRGIPFQMDVSSRGGTDAGAIHKSRGGVCSGGLSIPCRYTHSPMELIAKKDALACAELLAAFAEAELEQTAKP